MKVVSVSVLRVEMPCVSLQSQEVRGCHQIPTSMSVRALGRGVVDKPVRHICGLHGSNDMRCFLAVLSTTTAMFELEWYYC